MHNIILSSKELSLNFKWLLTKSYIFFLSQHEVKAFFLIDLKYLACQYEFYNKAKTFYVLKVKCYMKS